MLDKNIIYSNIKTLVESVYYYDLYNRLVYSDSTLENKESLSAQIFNTIVIVCQLVNDIDSAKKVIEELLSSHNYTDNGMLQSDPIYIYNYLNILKKYDESYLNGGENLLVERLKHGFSIHFTTSNIIKKIQDKGSMRAYESMFSKDVESKIIEAGEEQIKNNPESLETGVYLHQGFGFSKGISMGSQTVDYWMNHTPESLSFLFGGYVFTRDKERAMEYVRNAISSIEPIRKQEMYELLSNIWDEYVGEAKTLGCILIDRDSLEYETVTYWNEEPPRVEEIRPYEQNGIRHLAYAEESRYKKDIDINALYFLHVPSIMLLEEYCKQFPLDDNNKLRARNTFNFDDLEDIFNFDEEVKTI